MTTLILPQKNHFNNAAAYRKNNGSIISRPIITRVPNPAATLWQDSATLARLDNRELKTGLRRT